MTDPYYADVKQWKRDYDRREMVLVGPNFVYQISEGVRFFSWNRVESIYHNKRGGDCAPCAVKFMEMHLNGDGKEEMSLITCRVVDKIREQYAMDCYEEFVGDYQVANEASMK
ncbi:hypothetical protein F2Q70_00025599 [Brassica cretica]|uniref:Ubiquitin-like protease family profile domain-containing protein n=1 Tax=Brassica cretica TaxID=69181 RepID=A0A8S9LEU8_BRACR|nr:hypothetical protein F2Q70_00025599 [Brassica cretica]